MLIERVVLCLSPPLVVPLVEALCQKLYCTLNGFICENTDSTVDSVKLLSDIRRPERRRILAFYGQAYYHKIICVYR